ncbi:MAG: hypothetical protein RIC55_23065 [Pirellulaceae bacterium]
MPNRQAEQEAADRLEMALAQRGMMWFFVLKLAIDCTVGLAMGLQSTPLLAAYFVAFFTVEGAIAVNAFRLGRVVYGFGPGLACMLIVLPPCMGTMVVLILNGNVMDRLRKAGVKSGFMGVTKQQLDELRRQAEDEYTYRQFDP